MRRPCSPEVSQPSPPTDKSRDEPFFPGGVVLRATGPLHVPCTLRIPYKHICHVPKPVTLHSPSCTRTLVQVTSLNPDYLTFLLCLSILSRTQHEPLTKLLCQDLAQHNTVYSSFSRSFLSFLSKFLILYVRSIKQLNFYVAFSAPLHSWYY